MIEAKENGKVVYRQARQLLVRGFIAKAARGDVRAMDWLMNHCSHDNFGELPAFTLVFPEEEKRRREIEAQNRRLQDSQGNDD